MSGEWLFLGGYVGEVVTRRRSALTFAPDRGVGQSIVGRVGRTVGVSGNIIDASYEALNDAITWKLLKSRGN